jgi:2-methylcitrate dehydratase
MSPHSDAPPSGPRPEYDQEIKDMASYIHNYKIESELAVREEDSFCP